ncbi:hypothetical protein KY316_01835, partial [Candidatus Woesearchaeota archaeon]|nr:hypothetical protein [Candidatus Woesearchaeota archaeon]
MVKLNSREQRLEQALAEGYTIDDIVLVEDMGAAGEIFLEFQRKFHTHALNAALDAGESPGKLKEYAAEFEKGLGTYIKSDDVENSMF